MPRLQGIELLTCEKPPERAEQLAFRYVRAAIARWIGGRKGLAEMCLDVRLQGSPSGTSSGAEFRFSRVARAAEKQ